MRWPPAAVVPGAGGRSVDSPALPLPQRAFHVAPGLMPPTAPRVAVGGVSEVSATMETVSMLRSYRRTLGQWLLGRGTW